ncbi:MAG: HEAT repeat domain-containing protein [Halanaerobiaceae bacterium]
MTGYLETIIILITIATFSLVVIILFYHFLLYWKERIFERKREQWEPLFLQYLDGEKDLEETAELFDCAYTFLYQLFITYLNNCKNINRKDLYRLRALASKLGMTDYYLKKIESPFKKRKIRAINFLTRIEEVRALDFFEQYLNANDQRLMLASARGIARIGEERLFVPVLRNLFNRTNMTFEGISDLMIIFGEDISLSVKNILEDYLEKNLDLNKLFEVDAFVSLSLLIDILGYFKYRQAIEILEELLKVEENNEVIIHIFKTLRKIEEPVEIDLDEFIMNNDWVIRSQVVRYIAAIRDSRYIDELKELLSDKHWWVRYYAAQALYVIGEKEFLGKIAETGDLASNISEYVLAQLAKENREVLQINGKIS